MPDSGVLHMSCLPFHGIQFVLCARFHYMLDLLMVKHKRIKKLMTDMLVASDSSKPSDIFCLKHLADAHAWLIGGTAWIKELKLEFD